MSDNGFGISDEGAIARMYELARDGAIDNQEFALLDAVIHARLRETYDAAELQVALQAPALAAA